MAEKLHCQMVDLSSLPSITMSLPLAYLQAYAEADSRLSGRLRFSTHCRYLVGALEPVSQAIQQEIARRPSERHVVAFSNYCWNRQLHASLAERIKTEFPETLLIFGGNDVTNQGDEVLADSSPVDVVINGEGEIIFSNLLAQYLEGGDRRQFHDIRGVSFRDRQGRVVTTDAEPRITELDTIPTPFHAGTAADIASSTWIMCELSRGCPFQCSFCYWGGAIGTRVRRFSGGRIASDFDFIIRHMQQGAWLYLADANFGMTDADYQAACQLVETVHRLGKRIHVFTNWAKNTNRRVLETATLLFKNRLISRVTLAAQSVNPEVLATARRKNIPFAYYRQLQDEFRRRGMPTYTELLLGMPGEGYRSFLNGIEQVLGAGGTPIIYPLLLLNNTEYNDPAFRERHGIRSRLMPFQTLDISVQVDTLIGHDRLTFEEWLKGIGLMIGVPIFYFALLKFVMERLRAAHGLGYGEMLDAVLDYCMAGRVKSNPGFQELFLNYIDTWRSPENYDGELLESFAGGKISGQFGPPHFQVIMRVLVNDPAAAKELAQELSEVLAGLAAKKLNREEFRCWVAYQELIVEAVTQAAMGTPGTVTTGLTRESLQDFAGCDVAVEQQDGRRLEVRRKYQGASFNIFIFNIIYGSTDTLRMFEQVGAPHSPSPQDQDAVQPAASTTFGAYGQMA